MKHLDVLTKEHKVLGRVLIFLQTQFFPLTGGCSEGLGAFRFFFNTAVLS